MAGKYSKHNREKPRKNRRHKSKLLLILGLAAAIFLGYWVVTHQQFDVASPLNDSKLDQYRLDVASPLNDSKLDQYRPEFRDITYTVESSGVLEAASKFSIISDAKGIIGKVANQNDVISNGDLLFAIFSADGSSKFQPVHASIGGIITESYVSVGDYVTNGQKIAKIRDNSQMLVHSYFASDVAKSINVGDEASVNINWSGEIVGKVRSIANSDSLNNDNRLVREVVVVITNTGKITDRSSASVAIDGKRQLGSASVKYFAETDVKSQSDGVIVSLSQIGDVINPNDIVATISSGDNSNLGQTSLSETTSTTEGIIDIQNGSIINAPFEGELAECLVSVGDFVNKGDTLGTLADLSYLKLTIKVDEYQISYIKPGQQVEIYADALPDVSFSGQVTNVSKIGTTTGGITSYSVLINVAKHGDLIPGMRVNTSIVAQQATEVLSIPNEAITRDFMVLITSGSPSAKNATGEKAPSGCVYVPVTIGISDDNYTEIRSGLSSEDVVVIAK